MIKACINEEDFDTFKIKVEKLQKIAAKLQLESPNYRIVGEKFVPHPDIPKCLCKILELEIDDVNVTFSDWRIVCHIKKVSEDLVIKGKIIGNAFYYPLEELPESCYEKAPTLCEHCGKNIANRSLTFILKNDKTGEYKQVGSTCVKNFVSDTRNITAIINFLEKYTDYINHVGVSGDRSRARLFFPTRDVLKVAVDTMQELGWVSKWDAEIFHSTPTTFAFRERVIKGDWECKTNVTDEVMNGIIEFHENVLLELSEQENLNSYDSFRRNCALQIVNSSVECEDEYLNYVVSGVKSYFAQFTRKPTKNDFYGKEGEEFHDKFIVTKVKPIVSKFGECLLVMMVNHDGYGFKTFAGLDTKFGEFLLDKKPDFVFEADAKVKSFDEFRGSKNTMLYYFKNFEAVAE